MTAPCSRCGGGGTVSHEDERIMAAFDCPDCTPKPEEPKPPACPVDYGYAGAEYLPRFTRWGLRHADECPVGSHCESSWCHYKGSCSCGLEEEMGRLIVGQRERGVHDDD